MRKYRRLYQSGIILTILVILLIAWGNVVINNSSKPYLTDDIAKTLNYKAGLLLGTRKNLQNGEPNEYFMNRITATVDLYKNGKIKYVIISGDNSTANYNEPQDMKAELIKYGIPDSAIYLDFAGFRTFDSVVRAKEVFGQDRIIVISQKFHNERAIYIARRLGIEAFGYNAKDVSAYKGIKTRVREFFARAKVFFDLTFGTRPRFLGTRIQIG